jgi:hypothetical protein
VQEDGQATIIWRRRHHGNHPLPPAACGTTLLSWVRRVAVWVVMGMGILVVGVAVMVVIVVVVVILLLVMMLTVMVLSGMMLLVVVMVVRVMLVVISLLLLLLVVVVVVRPALGAVAVRV